jgi:flagellar biosynthesis/type III secretory pathway protein FliH
MGLIVRSRSRVVPAVVVAAEEQAKAILARAEAEAQASTERLAAARAEAVAAGRAEGVRQGREEGHAEALGILAAARAQGLAEHRKHREAGIAIGRKMAEKILGRALALDPSIIAELAEQAILASRPRGGPVVVHAHPEDVAALTHARQAWLASLAAVTDIRVVPEAGLERGSCVVETPVGRLDARLATQLDALEAALRGALANGEDGAR